MSAALCKKAFALAAAMVVAGAATGALAQGSLLGGLAGKSGKGPTEAPAPEPVPVPTPAPVPAPAKGSFTGVWQGTYTCAQGVTGLTLTFAAPAGGEVTAEVSFYAVASNPGVPSGRFTVVGSQPAPGDRKLEMFPLGWIERPPGYAMIGFDLELSADELALRASLNGAPDCTKALMARNR